MVKLNPDDAEAYYDLAIAYKEAGDTDSATKLVNKLREFKRSDLADTLMKHIG